MIYLACPYSDPDPAVVDYRFRRATEVTGQLMKQGLVVFSPITHSHLVAQFCEMPTSWEFWAEQDLHILRLCDGLHVLHLQGWEKSVGVQAEIEEAKRLGLHITHLYTN